MYLLPLTFVIYSIFGFWRPTTWKSSVLVFLYNIFTFTMFSIIFLFALSELMSIILNVQNVDEFTENSFLLLSIVSACFKAGNIMLKRKALITLSNVLLSELCKFRDDDEQKIQRQFDKIARSNTVWYMALIQSSVFMISLQSLLVDIPQKKLPFLAWLPYNYSSARLYTISYVHQLIGNAASASLHVANDTLISGMMLQICAQLGILKYRIENLSSEVNKFNHQNDGQHQEMGCHETETLKIIVQHHNCIYKFAKDMNDIFAMALFAQFSIAALVICSSVYQLSKMNLFSADFVALTSYLACVLVQIFLYCWYGNSVTTKSLDINNTIYNTDWSYLSIGVQKSLLIIMIRAKQPIELKTGRIFALSIMSFTKIINASYSAFNFMQHS